ncbi:phosphodiesterase [Vibrio quintilis]|uniref:3',5'-cyclic adenosine monophosphate phosphodiesterase CpdA n=1 Tax=Vibrio quintilis TaxID=1117707 RepID=A0A1M7Z200_9VIBR|nr:phosphodiesterase [Vibrio quintilis]SHO58696.1 3',5'-cyclic adenosine monophosphate phosphodiesterase CpdA [Vibrio quintilis]
MLIAQLTDLHIREGGKPAYRKVDTLACLREAVNHINALQPRPDLVVVTGDLGDYGTPEEYAVILPELQRLQPAIQVIPGNHDHRGCLREALAELTTFDHPHYCNFIRECGGYVLVGLDTSVIGQPYGLLSDETLIWLDQVLQTHADRPVLLFMHHPPMAVGLNHMDVQKLQNDDQLYDVLTWYSHVKGIVTGHLHRPVFALWHDLPVWVGPAHNHAVTLDLDPQAPSSFSLESRAIQLFALKPEGIVSHLSYLGAGEGPFPFFDENHQLIC